MSRCYIKFPSLLGNPFFFFNDTATTEIYTLSLHDALPISSAAYERTRKTCLPARSVLRGADAQARSCPGDRKSTRLNSSHGYISYAVFCLKKKKKSSMNPYSLQLTSNCVISPSTHSSPLSL